MAKWVLSVAASAIAAFALCVPGALASHDAPDFEVRTNSFGVDQAPSWTPDARGLLFHRRIQGEDGVQLMTARLDGAHQRCLTCKQPGSNQFAQFHPSHRWIFFHSHRGKQFKLFAPGGGGVGSDIWIARPDGSQPAALTSSPEGQDNFHAYFSPDGTRMAWTHINWALHEGGRGYWDVRVADFVATPSGPKLRNVKVILPPNGDFYETQHWSPDGRGFLLTRSRDNAMNLELHFLDLSGGEPKLTRLTNHPAWDEQAVFTPDGRKVIFMSTRDHPSDWESWAQVSWTTGAPTGFDHLLTAAMFASFFNSPVAPPSNDLYELDYRTRALRRLTHSGDEGWIIPEFSWDPAGERLLWTELRWGDRYRASLPPDPVREAYQLIDTGDTSDIDRTLRGLAVGRPAEAAERRTRIARYLGGGRVGGERSACLRRRVRVTARRIGPIRLGLRRATVRRRVGRPQGTKRRTYRYCVHGGGRVRVVFSKRWRVRALATTAPGHRTRRAGVGARVRSVLRRHARMHRIGRGLYALGPRGRLLVRVRRGRVRELLVVPR